MQFRIGGRRDDRRRRVLMDEAVTTPEGTPAETARPGRRTRSASPARNYGDGALGSNQPPWTAWLPTRRFSQSVILLSLLTALAGLLAAYGRLYLHVPGRFHSQWLAFDLEGRGNLAQWVGSFVLGIAAILSTFIYRLRRHKLDDYRGRYRLWLWTAVVLWIASMDATAGLHHAASCAIGELVGQHLPVTGNVWGLLLYLLPASVLGIRLTIELWGCRLALASLTIAGCCYTIALLISGNVVLAQGGALRVMIGAAAALLGHISLLGTGLFYGRHVYYDAHGLLPAADATKKEHRRAKREQAHKTPAIAPSAGNSSASSSASHVVRLNKAETPGGEEAKEDGRLSKAERRKLRKLRRQSVG